jgi:hypothetical protein
VVNTTETLNLALEALEKYKLGASILNNNPDDSDVDYAQELILKSMDLTLLAIPAIKEVLAQPNAEYERGFVDGMQKQMQSSVDKAVNIQAQPEQEPIAWLTRDTVDGLWYPSSVKKSGNDKPLYDTRRKWVGLTTAEALSCMDANWQVTWNGIEVKLKEKNT